MSARYEMGKKLFEILRNIRIQHGGDFEEYLILYALMLADDYHRRNSVPASDQANWGVNLLSIAEITGIPRETVRRKVSRLIAEGSVVRDENGLHYYTGDPASDDITAQILRDLPTVRETSAYGDLGEALQTRGKAGEKRP